MSHFWTQIEAMVYKGFLVYFRVWKVSLKDLAIPMITALYIYMTKTIPGRLIPLQFILPLSLIGHLRTTLYEIVMEKSEKYKEYLMINGLSRSTYILSNLVFIYLKCLLITFTTCLGFILANDMSASLIIRMHLVYFLSAVAVSNFALFITSFFDSKELCSDLGGFSFAVLSFMYIGALVNQTTLWYNFAFLFPQNCLSFEIILQTGDTPLNLVQSDIFIHLILDAIVYLLLYIYLDQVLPNQYGVRKNWLYCFTDYGKKRNNELPDNDNQINSRDENNSLLNENQDQSSAEFHQALENSQQTKRSVYIRRVTKKFGEEKVIDTLSMMIYENQVFCLLGHNGAGKTTTINMLSGILEYDEGQIYIYDTLLKEDMDENRKNMGICCQQDILFGELTVVEHLELIGKLRGYTDSSLEREIRKVLDKVHLNSEADKFARSLSGGNQRKLSLAMAILGNSKIIFLDEPTSGLDPNTRRFIWDIIKQLRHEGKTILLTTHHLDEADELADRIAIMSHGKLFALGSSSFIKKNFGEGYQLTILPTKELVQRNYLNSVELEIDQVIKQYLPSLTKKRVEINNEEIQYLLPFDLQEKFSEIFSKLEKIEGIKINLHMNSLEDAFINIGLRERSYESSEESNSIQISQDNPSQINPVYNFKSQIKGLFYRKYYSVTRDTTTIMMILLPVFFVFIGISISVQNDVSHVLVDSNNAFSFLFFINFAFCLNATVYAAFPVYERETKIRYLLKAMGVKNHCYWIGTFAFDVLALTIVNGCLLLFVYLFGLHLLQNRPLELIVALYTYGFALVTSAYMYGFFFAKASAVYKGYAAFYFFVLLLLPQIVVGVLKVFEAPDWILKLMKLATYHISPMLIFQDTMVFLMIGDQANFVDGSLYFDSFGACALFMLYLAIIFAVCAYFLEKNYLNVSIESNDIYNSNRNEIDDNSSQEIKNEFLRVNQAGNQDPIKVLSLKKNYRRNFTAVNNISFGVQKGEIFGLLGPNGAGKSTTFGVITALIARTSGQVFINHKSIDDDLTKAYIEVGLCPQFDSLWEHITVREHLSIHARLKGMKKEVFRKVIEKLINNLKITEHSEKRANELSGGTKRKLSTAIALVSNPSILILDEPTTGLDPLAKRHLWKILEDCARIRNSSIILTTHSMEEADHLCNRIGIIVNGKFVCFGTLSYLKNTYGSGYKVTLTKKGESNNALNERMNQAFQNAIKIDSTAYQDTFNINYEGFLFSKAFNELEKIKSEGLISDFSIYNTTIEQVFLKFAKNQINHEVIINHNCN